MAGAAEVDILIVEDDPRDLELALRALGKRNLTNLVQVARDGAEALDFLLGRGEWASGAPARPRVILLDLGLPKVGGLEVLEQVRASRAHAATPVVVVTSSAEQADLEEAYRLGANGYVVKSADPEEFSDALETLGFYWSRVNHPPL